ncbi:restriction endonuclease [Xanthomonas sp. LMG 12462]|uniref:restriction endonuclease n=1 Tax=Xanthomonas sp. LMG 12462 TaxID=1591134 RepID=UPI001264D517|nr:restriction endonuclease [Xanthomonas sp. LMG 12462]KAB7772535.1 restriction endonuclease [Xanthomonas sp. LMG 12462]
MGRRQGKTGFDALAALPWPVGIMAGIAGFLAVRDGIPWWFSRHDGALSQAIAQQAEGAFAPLAWILLLLCWMAALASFLKARHRRRLLDTRTTLESLAAGGWRQFELLVGEAFRRQGYSVEETGLGGADGGIDLILRKDDRRTLVQCKQWKRQQVSVSVVREMYGLLAHHQADAVKIVCVGRFTNDAERYARGKPIELIGGAQLIQMIRAVQQGAFDPNMALLRVDRLLIVTPSIAAVQPRCPRCGSAQVQRMNRRTSKAFLGCSQFPKCR